MWKQDNLLVGQTYLYGWNRMGRKGQPCVLEVIGRKMNSVQVRFEDGQQAITSANALKSVPAGFSKPTEQPGLF
jgi:hypothetical protein